MSDAVLHSNWDTLLVALPFLILMLIGFFRLDEVLAAPKHRALAVHAHRAASGTDEHGLPILCDPDGRRWKPRARS